MITTLEEKKEILSFITNFSDIAREQKWISHYDTDSDSLVIRIPKLSENSRKKYFNDEFAFYLNKKNEVEGIFMEYFISNFVYHHASFRAVLKDVKKDIKNSKKNNKSILEFNQSEIKKIIPELESVIIDSLIPNNKILGSNSV